LARLQQVRHRNRQNVIAAGIIYLITPRSSTQARSHHTRATPFPVWKRALQHPQRRISRQSVGEQHAGVRLERIVRQDERMRSTSLSQCRAQVDKPAQVIATLCKVALSERQQRNTRPQRAGEHCEALRCHLEAIEHELELWARPHKRGKPLDHLLGHIHPLGQQHHLCRLHERLRRCCAHPGRQRTQLLRPASEDLGERDPLLDGVAERPILVVVISRLTRKRYQALVKKRLDGHGSTLLLLVDAT